MSRVRYARLRHAPACPAPARGVAFVIVLWVIAMLSILLGSFALIARTENLQARHLFDATQARYAAEAGLNLAVYELRKGDPAARWVGDGRPYTFGFGDAEVEVRIFDDTGKIDLNAMAMMPPRLVAGGADQPMMVDPLTNLFVSQGVDPAKAEELRASIRDWIDPDDEPSPGGAEISDYKAVGLSYGPKNAPFDTVSELQQVLGMNYDLYSRIEPALTIYSGQGQPNLANSGREVLIATGCTPEQADDLIRQRQALMPGDPAAATLMGCDGKTPLMTGGGGLTYSVQSRAKLSNGASTVLDATIRMGGVNAAGRPFVILRWRDDENS